MSDYDRGKYYGKKKFASPKENFGRTYIGGRNIVGSTNSKVEKENKETKSDLNNAKIKTPMIIIKREKEQTTDDVTQSPKRTKEPDTPTSESLHPPPQVKSMTKSVKFLDDSNIITENVQDFLQENNDFLVVGIVGMQGVGKSTILNLLAHNELTEDLKKSVFKSEKPREEYGLETTEENENNKSNDIFKIDENIESNSCTTSGIDIFITENRMILLDCQPFISISVLDDLVQSENKRSNIVSEFIPLENSGEILGLQITAFLMSVCHVLIVVQDWFFDSNVVRFLQTAEMLKPTHSNPEDELIEHFPHLLLIHNKAQMEDFTPIKFKKIQDIYGKLFNKTKMGKCTNLGLASSKIMGCFQDMSEDDFNIFLVPEYDSNNEIIFHGHPPIKSLVKQLRANVLGVARSPLTHVQLTEKTWLAYCSKAWDNVKKSSFFVEYTKLMP